MAKVAHPGLWASGLVLSILLGAALQAGPGSADELLRQAEALIQEEKFEPAGELLLRARRLDPKSIEVRYRLGYVLFRQRRLEASKSEFQAIVKAAPPALYSRYFLGRIAMLEGRPKVAAAWLEPVAASATLIFDAAAQLATAYVDSGQPGKAAEILKVEVQRAPWDQALHYRLGRTYQQLGQKELAREELRTSERLERADLETVQKLLECSQHLAKGEKEAALRLRRELLEKQQVDPDALIALGVVLGNAGLPAEALEPFQTAAARDPSLFQAQYNAGLTLLKLGRAAEARAPLEKAVLLLPQSFDANAALALAGISQGQEREAIPALEAARQVQPGNGRVVGLLATAYLHAGTPEKAVPVLRAGIAANPQDLKLYLLLIDTLHANHDERRALEAAEEARPRFPDVPQANMALAQELVRAGRYHDAEPLFRKVSELAPGDIHALLGLGEVLEKKGDYEGSLAAYRRALQIEPQNLTAQLGVGKNLTLLQRYSDAREALEKAVARYPGSATLRLELARVYARLGDAARAAEQTRMFQQLHQKEAAAADAAAQRPAK